MRGRIFGAAAVASFLGVLGYMVYMAVTGISSAGSRPFVDVVSSPLEQAAALEVKLAVETPKRALGQLIPGDGIVFRVHIRRGAGPYQVALLCTRRIGAEEHHLIDSATRVPARASLAFVAGLAARIPASAQAADYDCRVRVTDADGESASARLALTITSRAGHHKSIQQWKRLTIKSMTIKQKSRLGGKDLYRINRDVAYVIGVTYSGGTSVVKLRARLSDVEGRLVDERLLGEVPIGRAKLDALSSQEVRWHAPLNPSHHAGWYTLSLELSEDDALSVVSRRVWVE